MLSTVDLSRHSERQRVGFTCTRTSWRNTSVLAGRHTHPLDPPTHSLWHELGAELSVGHNAVALVSVHAHVYFQFVAVRVHTPPVPQGLGLQGSVPPAGAGQARVHAGCVL
jgi:hypothetical protein